jgi:hypothetical protein
MAIVATMKALGPVTALSYGAALAVNRTSFIAWHRYRLIAVPRLGMPTMPRNYEVRELSSGDLNGFVIDVGPEVQRARFAQGMHCIGAFEHGNLVGVNWLTIGSFDEDEVRVRFLIPERAAWDTGLWVRPDRRLSRAFAALWAGTADWLAARELDWSMSRIADYNLVSLGSHRRMRARDIGQVAVLKLGAWQFSIGTRPHRTRLPGGAMPLVRLELPA